LSNTQAEITEIIEAARTIVQHQKPRGVAEKTAIGLIITARKSLWYKQTLAWINRPPLELGPLDRTLWVDACKIIIEMVDAGYDAERKTWWYVQSQDPTSRVLTLSAFGDMLNQHKHNMTFKVDGGFSVFLDLALGNGWEKRYAQFVRVTRKGMNRETRKGTFQGQAGAQ